MANQRSTHRTPQKPHKKRHVLRNTLLSIAVILGAAAGVVAWEYNKLKPENHFSNLPVVTPKGEQQTETNLPSGVFNVLLIGSDQRPGQKASHTDSMVLVHVDLQDHQYNMLSIPRDTRVYMQGYGYTKLTSVQYIAQSTQGTKEGIVQAVAAVSQLTGVPINYYAETNYWGLQDLVNALGGITMTLPFDVRLTHPWYPEDRGKVYTKGVHYMTGKDVAEVVHERDSVPGTDYGRQLLQQAALAGIAKKAMSPSEITHLPTLAKEMSKFLIATNMSTEDFLSLGLAVKSDFNPNTEIHHYQVPGTSQTMYDDILKNYNSQVVLDTNKLHQIMQDHFVGRIENSPSGQVGSADGTTSSSGQ
ncbi:LCP family protein [Alicyclobacillus herbarius]|uniref:LCP family protein n=1 Tax=Alicyclobacillus herbarius TaxID=122960 RepID=UPI0003FA8E7E|nr:LCP family protein [Alicyclobacillus herbarius]